MARDELLGLVEAGDFDAFEARCLDMLEQGRVDWAALADVFGRLESNPQAERAATVAQMLLEQADDGIEPAHLLPVARVALLGDPDNAALRERVADLLGRAHAGRPGVDRVLDMSGLRRGRAVRMALRLIDLSLSLRPGEALRSRSEDAVAEVVEVDLPSGLVTLRRGGRPTTVRLDELAREYERIEADDFRVLRDLKPQQLAQLVTSDPVRVVVGLLHAHDGRLDQHRLKRELVPACLPASAWSSWWIKTRNLLRRHPHVVLEGRSPVVLTWTAEVRTAEDETWRAFTSASAPAQWLSIVEDYLRSRRRQREAPDADLLNRCVAHVAEQIESQAAHRPADAFACALVADRIASACQSAASAPRRAPRMLAEAACPWAWFGALADAALWNLGLEALAASARPDLGRVWVRLVGVAPAGVLDDLVERARQAGQIEGVQGMIEAALAEPLDYPELLYWLWKGPREADGLRLPDDDVLFTTILEALVALGRTLQAEANVMRNFRKRMRAALGLRDYARARRCLHQVSPERAVTLRFQLRQLEGVGQNVREKLLALLREAHPALWAATPKPVEPWEDADVLWNTQQGIAARTKERDELVNVKMRENARRIGEAAAHGDLSENSEYKFALEERDLLRARLAQYNNELSIARPIDPKAVPTDHVGIGSRVVLRDLADGSMRTITFLGPFDADVERGIYSYKAPLSQQILGRRCGDRVRLGIDGREHEFELVQISNGLSAQSGSDAAPASSGADSTSAPAT